MLDGTRKTYMQVTAFDAVYEAGEFNTRFGFWELHKAKTFLQRRVIPKFGVENFVIEKYNSVCDGNVAIWTPVYDPTIFDMIDTLARI